MSLGLISPPVTGLPGGSACRVQLLCTCEQLTALAPTWRELYATSPTAAPPLAWDWVERWWHHYGPVYGQRGRGLRVLAVHRADLLIGVLPLYQGRLGAPLLGARRLGFVSTGEAEFEGTYPEYLDLLHAPGAEEACCQALAPALLHAAELRWDELHLYELASTSPLLALAGPLAGGGRRVTVRASSPCSFADTTGGMEEYFKRLSPENRRQARKMLREADSGPVRYEIARPEQVDVFFDQLLDLHKNRWNAVGNAGAFAPRHAQFHRELARLLVPRGEAVLARLVHGERPLAVVYGYRTRDKLHCYQQGVDFAPGPLRSPGTAAWLLLMRQLAAEGVNCFDHQKGMTTFKERFCPGRSPMIDLRVVRPTPRALSHFVSDLAYRAARKGVRLAAQRLRRQPASAPAQLPPA